MSSLVAIIDEEGRPARDDALGRAIGSSRRGPDHHGSWTSGPVGLAHGLLDVGGRATATPQPATLDGELWITADARIDDRRSLLRELGAVRAAGLPDGLDPGDTADHELLLYAYRAWGRECIDRLIGDFAFAIWDSRARTLFCARDQLGVAPLFYAATDGRLIVASELDVIRSFPGVSQRLDDLTVADLLMFGLSIEPDATAFAGIRRLPGAHTLTWSEGKIEVARYWELSAPTHVASSPDPASELEQVLGAAVDDRLRGADAAGVWMSGGIDSTLVAALAGRDPGRRPAFDLRAETIVFDHLLPDDERRYAGIAAAALCIPIEFLPADDYRLFSLAQPTPEPLTDPLAALNVDLTRSLATHGPVVLTGDDADSLCFAWLPTHFQRLIRDRRLSTAVRELGQLCRLTGSFPPRGATGLWSPMLARRRRREVAAGFPDWLDRGLVEDLGLRDRWTRIKAPERHWSRPPEADAVEVYSGPHMRYTLEFYDPGWSRVRASVRHPMLDLRVIEYVLALPPIPWKVEKTIFRRMASRYLPPAIAERPKTPLREDSFRAAVLAGQGPEDAELRSSEIRRFLNPAVLPSPRDAALSGGLNERLHATAVDLWLRTRET